MVTFVIGQGKEKETFMVHKEHACKYSPVSTIDFFLDIYNES